MSQLKFYEIKGDQPHDNVAIYEDTIRGEWVKREDAERLQARNLELEQPIADYEEVNQDKKRLAKEINDALGGDAKQPSLCDIVPTAKEIKTQRDELAATVEGLRESLLYHAGVVDELDKYTHPNIECDAVAHEMREVANATPQQNLNHVKREAVTRFINHHCGDDRPHRKAGMMKELNELYPE